MAGLAVGLELLILCWEGPRQHGRRRYRREKNNNQFLIIYFFLPPPSLNHTKSNFSYQSNECINYVSVHSSNRFCKICSQLVYFSYSHRHEKKTPNESTKITRSPRILTYPPLPPPYYMRYPCVIFNPSSGENDSIKI